MKEMMKEMVGGCCVCSDERGWPDNPLVYCDGNGCSVAVHQACYGIIAVPVGPWYCRKCETPEVKGKVRCELCPSKSGALKHTDTEGWAHVVCALYIPEVRFGNVTSMEPIVLRLVPPERYNKTCYICQDQGKTHRANIGACMQCNKSGCKQQFHVTCAQSLGLLCEEAGNYLDNVKYCGYCQHHYGKLKKGGNVKTIPPYKPVTGNDSLSSDCSEKDEEVSPVATGSATPTNSKTKGPGRKTNNNTAGSSKNSPNNKLPNNTPMADKKKSSPPRRGSSAGDGGSTSKTNTPAPSPQHNSDAQLQPKGSGGSTPNNPAKIPLPSSSPKQPETGGVISSVASIPVPPVPSPTTTATVVQAPAPKPVFQESVITNAEALDIKQTKKRKAISSAPAAPIDYAPPMPIDYGPPMPVDYAPPMPVSPPMAHHYEPPPHLHPQTIISWENNGNYTDVNMEPLDKVIKKAKMEMMEPIIQPGPFSCLSPVPPPPPPPPPPPAHSPASHPSPRHLQSPMPGPSGLNQMHHHRSPSHLQYVKMRSSPMSLLVSVPLPPVAHGLNLTYAKLMHTPPEMTPMPHNMYHQHHKQAAMEPGLPGHSPHSVGRSAWSGLNVGYEMQDPNKPGVSGIASTSKDHMGTNLGPMPPTLRNKKRAAMATSVVSMAPTPIMQNMPNVRRASQQTYYHEAIKESPPSSPNSERPIKPKLEPRLHGSPLAPHMMVNDRSPSAPHMMPNERSPSAPHMLGNELNPESIAAARLQEQLSAELAAHAAGHHNPHDPYTPPPLINKAGPSTIPRGTGAQSLDQLLERQWEQGSQFLMEQAQHFDIASLLSCLHQLRTENVRLEEHVGNLLQRRDHLLAVNARLAIPLNTVSGPEQSRCQRDAVAPVPIRGPPAPPGPVRPNETITSERSHQLMQRPVQQKPS